MSALAGQSIMQESTGPQRLTGLALRLNVDGNARILSILGVFFASFSCIDYVT